MNGLIPDWGTFIGLTLVLGGAGAFAAGRAVASGWRPFAMALLYMVALAGATRFLHYALFEETTDLQRFALDYATLACFAAAGFYWERWGAMKRRYPWLSER